MARLGRLRLIEGLVQDRNPEGIAAIVRMKTVGAEERAVAREKRPRPLRDRRERQLMPFHEILRDAVYCAGAHACQAPKQARDSGGRAHVGRAGDHDLHLAVRLQERLHDPLEVPRDRTGAGEMDDVVRSDVQEHEIGVSGIGTGKLLGQDVMDPGAGNPHVRQLDTPAAAREMPGRLDGDPLFIAAALGDGGAVAEDQVMQRLPFGAEHSRRRGSPQGDAGLSLPGTATDRHQQEGREESSNAVHGFFTPRRPRWMSPREPLSGEESQAHGFIRRTGQALR
jgi:hypothetical protein